MSVLQSMGYLSDSEVAALLAVEPKTLANWRAKNSGPPYCRAGNVLLYPVAGLREWIADSVVTPAPAAPMPELTATQPRRAGRPRRLAETAQAGHANVVALLLAAVAAGAALLLGVEAGALAMAAPALGARAALVEPDPVDQALAGERAALRVLRRIADGVGTGDELLGELRDVVLDDNHDVPATPRLRAFCRTVQKRLEGRS